MMRFVGLTEVSSFVARYPGHAEVMRAWVTEVRYRTWGTATALLLDYPNADVSPPTVVFNLQADRIRIETLVDFRTGIVLLTQIHRPPVLLTTHTVRATS